MSLFLNILWVLFGGFFMGLAWFFYGVLAAITIVGLPWARACFNIGWFIIWPFGREAVNRERVTGEGDIGTGFLGMIGNVIWFVFAGFWLALGHLMLAIAYFVTIIGIPFGYQHVKFIGISMLPIGKTIVEID
ncbi:MAG: YccF domain-containing protein [Halieaceae bacterium]|nr:YccF domain-containing protein [Halieaceae bacterium]